MFKKLLSFGIGIYMLASSQLADARVNYAELPVPNVGYYKVVNVSGFPDVELAPFDKVEKRNDDVITRIQRTERWMNIINAVSKKHNVPADILKGLIMWESKGEPLMGNWTQDGGFGLVHFQPSTAQVYGMHPFARSNKIIDESHARKLEDMVRYCDYELKCVQMFDDRAHPIKNLDAAARYLRNNYQITHSWKKAVQSINPSQPGYAAKVFEYISYSKKFKKLAEKDFNERNKGKFWGNREVDYKIYLVYESIQDNNYGLGEYINNHNPYNKKKADYLAEK